MQNIHEQLSFGVSGDLLLHFQSIWLKGSWYNHYQFFFFFFLDKVCGGWIKLYFYDQSFKHMYLISNVSNGEPGLNIQFFLFCHTILINLSNGNVRASFFVTKRRVMLPIYEWASRSHYIITNMSKLVPHIRWNKIYSVISPSNKLFFTVYGIYQSILTWRM